MDRRDNDPRYPPLEPGGPAQEDPMLFDPPPRLWQDFYGSPIERLHHGHRKRVCNAIRDRDASEAGAASKRPKNTPCRGAAYPTKEEPAPRGQYELAFHIGTTGLDIDKNTIVLACVYTLSSGVKTFFFTGPDRQKHIDAFCRELDEATGITGFNAYTFDLPWIVKHFNVDEQRATKWHAKLFDLMQICKRTYGPHAWVKLNWLFELNGIPCRTITGKEAAEMAQKNDLEGLAKHCAVDVRGTHRLASMANHWVKIQLIGENYLKLFCRRTNKWQTRGLVDIKTKNWLL